MPYTTVVPSTTITASWGNANVRDQVVTPFASASARSSAITSPIAGMVTYRTDSDVLEQYDGANWTPVQANFVARTTSTSNSANVTTTETVVDSVTFTAVAGRRYRVTWEGSVSDTAAADNVEVHLRYAAGASVSNTSTLIRGKFLTTPGANYGVPVTITATISGIAAGQTTVGALIARTFGGGTVTAVGGANYARELTVEDIGT